MMRANLMKYFSFFLFIYLPFNALAQSINVSGKITDSRGGPIPFASVFVKNTSIGTSANSDGEYSLKLPKGNYTLRFSAIGYSDSTGEHHLSDNQNINIILKQAAYQLNDVVIRVNKEDPANEI